MDIEGNKIAGEILEETKQIVSNLGFMPRLAMIYIEGDENSKKYLEMKQSSAKKVGIDSRLYGFPKDITTKELRKQIVDLSKASVNHGIILELPMPEHINTQYVLNAIPLEKDPDVLSQNGQGAFFVGRSSILPPSVETVKRILEKHNVEIKGANVVVFGYGILIGKPISHWCMSNGATVFVVNEFTKDQAKISMEADIVITGANKINFVKENMIKDGAIVIDFGYGRNEEDVISGNVDYKSASKKASLITPVPGGVGPIGIACALLNSVMLIKNSSN